MEAIKIENKIESENFEKGEYGDYKKHTKFKVPKGSGDIEVIVHYSGAGVSRVVKQNNDEELLDFANKNGYNPAHLSLKLSEIVDESINHDEEGDNYVYKVNKYQVYLVEG